MTKITISDGDGSAPVEASWVAVLGAISAGHDLTAAATSWAMDEIMTGQAADVQIAAFAMGLRTKGETSSEVSAMAHSMATHARTFEGPSNSVDIVGTGGDQANTVNISTMSAIVTAAAGVTVVKHGNRASSSMTGTADVLEALGVRIEMQPEEVERCVREVGIGFCFAPLFHPAMRFAGPVRKALAIPTAFNLLGPLSNPAGPAAMLLGCANKTFAPLLADVLAERGTSALVVRGDDGLDELTTTTTSSVWLVHDGKVTQTVVDPTELGISPATPADLVGGDRDHNAQVVRDLLSGKPGPVRQAVLLNTAAALLAQHGIHSPRPEHVTTALKDFLPIAANAIDSGAATTLLNRWISFT